MAREWKPIAIESKFLLTERCKMGFHWNWMGVVAAKRPIYLRHTGTARDSFRLSSGCAKPDSSQRKVEKWKTTLPALPHLIEKPI